MHTNDGRWRHFQLKKIDSNNSFFFASLALLSFQFDSLKSVSFFQSSPQKKERKTIYI